MTATDMSFVALWASMLDDIEKARISAENRARAAEALHGLGHPAEQLIAGLRLQEHAAELELKRALRANPLGAWIRSTVGVGEKQGARLLASIGDPYWNTLHDRPRTVSELWAYCGLHTVPADQIHDEAHHAVVGQSIRDAQTTSADHLDWVAARRRKGQRANWSTEAKMRAFLIAESCIKQSHSPYRVVYERARKKYEDATHPRDCAQCKAKAGSELSKGHQHARALRMVSKEILKDLWNEARKHHEK